MLSSNSKGQVGNVFIAITIIILTGVLLYTFNDTINTERISLLNDLGSEGDTLLRLILYSLMPLIWGMWIFLSIFVVVYTVAGSRGVL